ncbi:BREX-1 system adenine-specific DNA-methyltransferase PglX [Bacillus salacetis]|uniref:site-specific DNA-methyltransferase (adenine-specific) n=1 Tax=Bacillus salacetis TaxID=2315464 RepID=A0A3A1QZ38_9BACI|nr:BREX-1 system adenine-specific DNA-methyltransferase PglX [Bacillus salacetis]RIW32680.1 BREX-1 system adenine-specific DNA-methyltransferase PglX [Bacillus salacetis]
MNKTGLKNFAISARQELLKKVQSKALKIGISAENIQKANIESSDAVFIDGRQLSQEERIQREKLIERIKLIGFDRVMEEVAYTWFNRFTALRFMEVNNYLPTKVRVLSSVDANSAEPDMMKEAMSLDLDLDKEYIYDLKLNNSTEELFKYLIIKHCNDLNRYLPFMFEKIDDYTEILFPEGLLAKDSFLHEMTDVEKITEEDWSQIEIIGWLYQFYIAEEKDRVFANLKKNVKISKETLPAATQLFTPKWIVKYMVENSLGKIWVEGNPENNLKSQLKYFLEEATQEDQVKKELQKIRDSQKNPEEITFLDPSCGSGHILVYAFDIFYEMYIEKGYIPQEIPKLILEKNLYGLDIDDRAVQLASFAIMMKAREKSRRIFKEKVQLNVCAIQETNWITEEVIEFVSKNQMIVGNESVTNSLRNIAEKFWDAKEYGSIINVGPIDLDILYKLIHTLENVPTDLFDLLIKNKIKENLPNIIMQSKILSSRYSVVCTNPPYMGQSGMGPKLSKYVKDNFPDSKSDLGTVFMEVCSNLTCENGYFSIINIPSWMFLGSFEKLRRKLIENTTFSSLLHLGRGIFGADFGTTAFVIRNSIIQDYVGSYKRLFESQSAVDSLEKKENRFFTDVTYTNKQKNYLLINGSPITYWAKDIDLKIFKENSKLGELAEPKQGLATADNNRFLRQWHEVSYEKIGLGFKNSFEAQKSELKWFPYNKGGAFRRWFGNSEYVINWENDGYELRNYKNSVIRSPQFYFKEALTWSKVTIGGFSIRYIPNGYLFDVAGCSIFFDKESEDNIYYFLALLNSVVTKRILAFLSPTVNYEVGHIASIPIKYITNENVVSLSKECLDLTKNDWDSYETSWDFLQHPFLTYRNNENKINSAYKNWVKYTDYRFNKIKSNEEELNKFFISIYGLERDVSSDVQDKDITVNTANIERDVKSFLSYAIGCIFGRYSLDEEGLVYAGGDFDISKYNIISVDKDNIIPILPGAYFEDDIISKITEFVKESFGEGFQSENLEFIAEALGKKRGETAKETIRRYFLNDFYKDHVQTYKKRPIYWLFTSGKQKAFNCLIYMHRYDKTTLSRIRTDYLHEYQTRLDSEKQDLLQLIESDASTKEISNAKKELKTLDKKIEELKEYDELLHHMADMQMEIDLDDGVAVNYEKFKGLVAKI